MENDSNPVRPRRRRGNRPQAPATGRPSAPENEEEGRAGVAAAPYTESPEPSSPRTGFASAEESRQAAQADEGRSGEGDEKSSGEADAWMSSAVDEEIREPRRSAAGSQTYDDLVDYGASAHRDFDRLAADNPRAAVATSLLLGVGVGFLLGWIAARD